MDRSPPVSAARLLSRLKATAGGTPGDPWGCGGQPDPFCRLQRGLGREQSSSTVAAVTAMPGDSCPGFIVDVGRCWRMVYDRNLQSDHCYEAPSWTGRWFSPKGDRWWRVWTVRRPRTA